MIATIGPFVQEAPRQWRRSVVLHILGSIAGGGASFGLLGCVGWLTIRDVPLTARWAGLGAMSLALALREMDVFHWSMPSTTRSVPKGWWMDIGPSRAASAYGFVLGIGFAPVIPFAAFYVLALWAFLSGDPRYAVGLGIAYGFGRALPVVVASGALRSRRGLPAPRLAVPEIAEWVLGRMRFAQGINGLAGAGLAGAAIAAAVLALRP